MKWFYCSFAKNWVRNIPGLSSVVAVLLLIAVGSLADATDVDTADGRHFSNCNVLKADGLGIYFRHSKGIARVLYEDLNDELMVALGPLPQDVLKAERPDSGKAAAVADSPKSNADESEISSIGALQLQFWQRVTYGVPEEILQARACCQMHRGRFAGVHRYSRFPCRQLAELDFLITTGILPRPAGVVTRRISHRAQYNFYF